MSNRYYQIPVHVKPYVKKYIAANYGDTILISMKNPASIVLYSFLQKQNIPIRDNPEEIKKRFEDLTESVFLKIQRRDQYSYGLYINRKNHLLINNFFEQEMLKRIFHLCDAYRKVSLPLAKAIEDFCQGYDIELDKDISLEATLKAEYRYRQSKKNLKKHSAVLSTSIKQPEKSTKWGAPLAGALKPGTFHFVSNQ